MPGSLHYRVHQILPDSWDWTGAAAAAQGRAGGGRTGSTSDLLETGELQQVYFHLLHLLISHQQLQHVLPQGELLSTAMSAVVKVRSVWFALAACAAKCMKYLQQASLRYACDGCYLSPFL